MDWYFRVINNYAGFTGRARRSEYWNFILINLLIQIGLTVLDKTIGTYHDEASIGLLSGVYSLFVFLPSLAVTMRRLHDIGRSGWWVLISFIPLLGLIVLLIFLTKDSDMNDNEYGPNPKAEFEG